jgi:hypothetical protein
MGRLIIIAISLICATSSGSLAQASLDSLLSAHADSMGLSREFVDPRCWVVTEELSGLGLTGRVETWAQAPAAVRTRLQLGPLTVETWYDGRQGWISDRNGASRPAEGNELDGMLVQALFSTGAWLLDKPPVPLAFARDASASTDTSLVLIVEPLLDDPLKVELDRRTLLPIATSFRTSDGEQRQTFHEWGWYEGVRVALSSELELAGLLALNTRLLTVERIEALPPEFFRPGEENDAGSVPDDLRFGQPVVEAQLVEDGLHLTVQGYITDASGSESPALLLVDTGAGANFIDAGVASRLGLSGVGAIPTLGVGGHAESSFVRVPALRIGEVRLEEQSWMASDFTTIRRWFDHPPSAVLGYDFLSRTVLEVDYPARRLRLHNPEGFEAPASGTALPLRMDANVPSIEVRIEGHPGWVHVDTGSNGALDLAQPFVEANGLLEGRPTEPTAGLEGVGGSARTRRGVVRSVDIGPVRLENVNTGFNEAERGIFAREDVAGILGAEILSRYRCIFDYPGRTLWLLEP